MEVCSHFGEQIVTHFIESVIARYPVEVASSQNEGRPLPLDLLKNVLFCLNTFEQHFDVITPFQRLYSFLRSSPSLCPRNDLVEITFPFLVGHPSSPFCRESSSSILNEIAEEKTPESWSILCDLLTIAHRDDPHYLNLSLGDLCFHECMSSDLQGLRKQGVAGLRSLLRNTSLSRGDLDYWNTFISLFETFDEFPVHLVRAVWPRVSPLLHKVGESPREFPQLNGRWMELLFWRGIRHGNPQVRFFVIAQLLSPRESSFSLSSEFVFQKLLPSLNDSSLYRGDRFGVGFLIPAFFLRRHDPAKTLFAQLPAVSNPVAFQFLLGSFDAAALPGKPAVLDDDVNSAGAGGELVSRESIDFALAGERVKWRFLAGEVAGMWETVLGCVRTKISRKSLQKKLEGSLLRVFVERVDDADSRDVVKVLKLFPFGVLMEQRESIFKLLKVERHDGDASQSPSCVSSFLLQADLLLPERNCRRTLEEVRSLHSLLFPPTPVRHPVDTPAVVQHILETKRLEEGDRAMMAMALQDASIDALSLLSPFIDAVTRYVEEGGDPAMMLVSLQVVSITLLVPSFPLPPFSVSTLLKLLDRLLHSSIPSPTRGEAVDQVLAMLHVISAGDSQQQQEATCRSLLQSLAQMLPFADSETALRLFRVMARIPAVSEMKERLRDDATRLLEQLAEWQNSETISFDVTPAFMAALFHPIFFGCENHVSLVLRVFPSISNSFQKSYYFTVFFLHGLSTDVSLLSQYEDVMESLMIMKETKEEIDVVSPPQENYARILTLQWLEDHMSSFPPSSQDSLQHLILRLLARDTVEDPLGNPLDDPQGSQKNSQKNSQTNSQKTSQKISQKTCQQGRQVQNSEENGNRLRIWQALCVLSQLPAISATDAIIAPFRRCFQQPTLRNVRHYMEIFAIQLGVSSLPALSDT